MDFQIALSLFSTHILFKVWNAQKPQAAIVAAPGALSSGPKLKLVSHSPFAGPLLPGVLPLGMN